MGTMMSREKLRSFDAGQVIFREGDGGRVMFVIREGQVRICKKVLDVEKTLDTFRKGDFFGEMALIEGLPRSASAVAETAVKLEEIDEQGFARLMGNGGSMAMRLMRELSARLREADRQIETLLLKSEESRVIHTLTTLSTAYGRRGARGIRLSRQFTPEQVGNHANVSTRIATKVLDDLVKGGFITYRDGWITLRSQLDLENFLSYLHWRNKSFL